MSRVRTWLLIILCLGAAAAWVLMRNREEGSRDAPGLPGHAGRSEGDRSQDRPTQRFAPARFHFEHDLFLPATEPAVVVGREAKFLQPSDEVFGLLVGGHARAYPITMISYHHVVNDVIRGIPVAVTY